MKTICAILLAGSMALPATGALAQSVTIGHFGNPTPMQAARAEQKFEEATGWDIEWRKFAAGTDVIAAMASGDIVLAELGSSPLAIAASQGVDLEMFMIAQVIGTAESLIVHDGSEIAAVEDLAGKRIATPVGSTAHFSLMGALKHAGIGETEVTIMNMPPDQIAAAWDQGVLDGAWIWEPVQGQIMQTGERLLGADQTAEWGFPTFDAWVVNDTFAQENAEALAAFARTMDEANQAYLDNKDDWTADSEPVQAIANETGADPAQVPDVLAGYTFIPLAQQLSDDWLANAPQTMQETAQFLVDAGRIDSAADDYSAFVTTSIAEAATQ